MKIKQFTLLESGPTLGGFPVKPLHIEDQVDDELNEIGPNPKIGPKVLAWQQTKLNKPLNTIFVSQGYNIKFTPTELQIYKGGDLVYKKEGDFSNPSNLQLNRAKAMVEKLAQGWDPNKTSNAKAELENVKAQQEVWKKKIKKLWPSVRFVRPRSGSTILLAQIGNNVMAKWDANQETNESETQSTQSKFEKHLAQHGYDVDERANYWTNKLKELEAQRQKYIAQGTLKPDDVAPIAESTICPVCGCTPCNCTHITAEALKLDAPGRVMPRDELHSYAGRIKSGTKTKREKFAPIIHASNIKAITKTDSPDTAWDLDDLAAQITTRPRAILGTNAKMTKSATEGEIVYDLTLPALSGIVVDEDTGDFVEVTTCPGAGQCQLFCYARKGGYVMFPASSMSAAQALNFLLNDPKGYMATVNKEIAAIKKRTDKAGIQLVVRWHDAGDFFSKEYLNLAYNIARANPDVKFYAYTKIADVATGDSPENFIINFSSGAKRGEEKKIEIHKQQGNVVKQGVTVPKDMFFDLIAREGNKLIKDEKGRTQFKSAAALDQFKRRLAQQYRVDPSSIITYDEMLEIPAGNEPKWNVIVQPGAGDRAANRKDVIDSYLMFH